MRQKPFMQWPPLLFVFILPLLTVSCATCYKITEEERIQTHRISEKMVASLEIQNPVEREMILDGLYSFLSYLVKKESSSILNEIRPLSTAVELRHYLAARYDKAPKEVIYEAFAYWDRAIPFGYKQNKENLEVFETRHFQLHAYRGTRAYQDIGKIQYLVEKYLEEIFRFVNADETRLSNFYRNLSVLDQRKIVVVLPPNSKHWKSFHSIARMEFGMAYGEIEGLQVIVSIHLPYYNPLSSAALTHEIAHMVDLLLKIEIPDNIIGKQATGGEVRDLFDEIMNEIFPHDTPLGEGFADYVSQELSIFHKRGLIFPPEKRLEIMLKKRSLIQDIFTTPIRKTRNRLFQYSHLHSVVHYLIETYGKEKFLGFYFTVPLEEKGFMRAYKKSYKEMEKEWREYYGLM